MALNGLPAFFQTNTKTVLDELTDFELEGGDSSTNQNGQQTMGTAGGGVAETFDMDAFETSTNAFGDLNSANLPAFFTNPSSSMNADGGLDDDFNMAMLDSVANITLNNDDKLASIPLPPGAKASSSVPTSGSMSSSSSQPPPGLTKSALPPPPGVNAPHYLSIMGLSNSAATAPTPPNSASAAVGLHKQQPVQQQRGGGAPATITAPSVPAAVGAVAAPVSYARAVGPSSTTASAGTMGAGAGAGAGRTQPPHAQQPLPPHMQQQQFVLNAPIAGMPPPPGAGVPTTSRYSRNSSNNSSLSSQSAFPLPVTAGRGGRGGVGRPITATAAGVGGAFSAQRPLYFNSDRGGFFSGTASAGASPHQQQQSSRRYQQQQQQQQQQPQQPSRKDVARGKFMSPSDVRYVVNRVLAPMESNDPFADDFYFIQYSIKKNAAARAAALEAAAAAQRGETPAATTANNPLPAAIYVPLPVWKETKERIRLQMQMTRRSFHARSREWERQEKVLGHQVRTDIRRPREQLAMPVVAEQYDSSGGGSAEMMSELEQEAEEAAASAVSLGGDGGDGGTGGVVDSNSKNDSNDNSSNSKNSMNLSSLTKELPFSSRLWSMRRAVQRAYEALYTVQELQHLLSSPLVAANPAAHAEIAREIDSAITLLSQSVGIRAPTIAAGGAAAGGDVAAPAGVFGSMPGSEGFTLDGGHVGAILQTTIGKKLMCRSLKLLIPPHRWALLPVILAKILLSTPPAENPKNPGAAGEALAVEQRLLKTIIEFLQYSYQYHVDMLAASTGQQQQQQASSTSFANILTANLRQCMKSVMVTQMEKSKLRQALTSERTRAEVMHMVVQIGDQTAPHTNSNVREEWSQTREAFMAMLDH